MIGSPGPSRGLEHARLAEPRWPRRRRAPRAGAARSVGRVWARAQIHGATRTSEREDRERRPRSGLLWRGPARTVVLLGLQRFVQHAPAAQRLDPVRW